MKILKEFLSEGREWFDRYIEVILEYANKIQESEIWLSTILNSIGDALIATDKLGNISFMNPIAENLTGWNQEEAIKKPLEVVFNIINEVTRKKVENTFSRILPEGVVVGLVNKTILIAKDGKEIPIEDSGASLKDNKGNFIGFVLIFRDTTERRKLEIAAKEAREYAESIVDTVREPLIVLDKDFRVISANKNFYDTFKVTPEESENAILYDLGNKQWDIPKLRELLEKILPKSTKFENYEVEHDFETIGKRIMVLNARRIDREDNKTQMILLAIEDITKLRELEIVAQEARRYAESIVDTVREPLVVLDKDFRVISANKNFYDTFKVTPEESENAILYDLGNKQWDIPKLRELLEKILPKSTKFENYEVEHDFETIGKRIMVLNARRLDREDNKAQMILLAIEDITKLRELEKKYDHAYNRAKLYKDLFAHDMSNIIQNISFSAAYYDRLTNKEPNNSSLNINEITRALKSQVKNAIKLISNIRELSSLEEESTKLFPIDLMEYLNNTIDYIRRGYQKKEIEFRVESFKDTIKVKANELIFNLFENIFINAIKYNKNQIIEITIKISRDERKDLSSVKIEILDNGIGIPENYKQKIFIKGHKEVKGTKGMGLGLSLVAEIIKIFKGNIWVENKVKDDYTKGSNFIIIIPEI